MAIKAPLSWLRDFVAINITPDQLAERLTTAGLEVETIEKIGDNWGEYCVVGQIREVRKHPNADALYLVDVEFGADKPITIITGAPNIREMEGNLPRPAPKVALALSGAMLIDAHQEDLPLKKLKPAKIRGIESEGMLCSELELGLSENHEGILILPEDAPVGTLLQEYLGDVILHFDIKGGFSHLLSILGIGREVAALTEEALDQSVIPDVSQLEVLEQPPFVDLEINDSDICSRYSALLIRDVKIVPSPFWMQQRLLRVGMRPINNIVDITNLVLHEYGQPMHAFDYDKLADGTIVVRSAKEGEEFVALDEHTYKLKESDLVIADSSRPVAVAGVMGGLESGVSDSTTRIVFEAANFNEISVRKTARSLNLYSDSQLLFEKGLSPQSTEMALKRAVELTLQVAGGSVASAVVDKQEQEYKHLKFTFDADRARKLIGVDLDTVQMLGYLETLGFTIEKTGEDVFDVTVPHWRDKDIEHDIDLIEEVARMYGYGNLPSELPETAPPRKAMDRELVVEDELKHLMQSAGYTEFYSNSLLSAEQFERYGLDPANAIKVENELSADLTHMRTSLMPSLLTSVEENQRRVPSARVFELSRTYQPNGKNLPSEESELVVAQFGSIEPREAFLELKGVLDEVSSRYSLDLTVSRLENDAYWHPTRSAAISYDGQQVGEIGQLSSHYQEAFSIERPVMIMRLALKDLVSDMHVNHVYSQVSDVQSVVRDIAIQVDRELAFADIQETILAAHSDIIMVALAEEYTGNPIPEGQKSITLSLTIQPETTLTSEQIEQILSTAKNALAKSFHATLR